MSAVIDVLVTDLQVMHRDTGIDLGQWPAAAAVVDGARSDEALDTLAREIREGLADGSLENWEAGDRFVKARAERKILPP